jgi:16S rRNA (cytosine967-C5)-methyltransferase
MALMVLKEVDEDGAYSNIALNRILEKQHPGKLDRSFTTELVYGTLRNLNTLDWMLTHYLKQPMEKQTSWVRNILRLGTYQIVFMDRVPDSAAVNESANLAGRYAHSGAVSFVNGVLRNLARGYKNIKYPDYERDPVAHIALHYAHPVWLVRRWLKEYGPDGAIALCRADNAAAPNTIRTNTLKITRDSLAERLSGEGVDAHATGFAPEGLNIAGFLSLHGFKPFEEGLFQVQDESSMLVGHAVSPAPGSFVLDAAGAPGGKATHLAQLMGDRGTVMAADIHPHKLKLIEDNCSRLGISCVHAFQADAGDFSGELSGRADYVLVDAPCSGLGVLRRRPDSRWRRTPEQIPELLELQRRILNSSARCLRPGGVLVYSTCTLAEEENSLQVERFINEHNDFMMDDLRPFLPKGLDSAQTMAGGYLQLLPHIHGTDGFFIARMQKRD